MVQQRPRCEISVSHFQCAVLVLPILQTSSMCNVMSIVWKIIIGTFSFILVMLCATVLLPAGGTLHISTMWSRLCWPCTETDLVLTSYVFTSFSLFPSPNFGLQAKFRCGPDLSCAKYSAFLYLSITISLHQLSSMRCCGFSSDVINET